MRISPKIHEKVLSYFANVYSNLDPNIDHEEVTLGQIEQLKNTFEKYLQFEYNDSDCLVKHYFGDKSNPGVLIKELELVKEYIYYRTKVHSISTALTSLESLQQLVISNASSNTSSHKIKAQFCAAFASYDRAKCLVPILTACATGTGFAAQFCDLRFKTSSDFSDTD